MNGSGGDDTFITQPDSATISGTGFHRRVIDFDNVVAFGRGWGERPGQLQRFDR